MRSAVSWFCQDGAVSVFRVLFKVCSSVQITVAMMFSVECELVCRS